MNISSLTGTQTRTESRRPAAACGGTAAASFQDLLAQSTSKAAGTPKEAAPASGRAALTKNDLFSALSDLKLTMLDRMKLSKEKEEEQEDWERLMKYLDAWIESLREEGSIEKTSRAYAALKAAQADAEAGRKNLGDCILEQLTECLAD